MVGLSFICHGYQRKPSDYRWLEECAERNPPCPITYRADSLIFLTKPLYNHMTSSPHSKKRWVDELCQQLRGTKSYKELVKILAYMISNSRDTWSKLLAEQSN